MIIKKVVFSDTAPNIPNAIWAKPVEGGFTLYNLQGMKWVPLKAEGKSGVNLKKLEDKLKAYIDEQLASLEE